MTALHKFTLRPIAAAAMVVAALALGGLAGCGGGTDTVAVAPPPLIEAESTGSKVMSWFAQIADSCYEVALGIASIAEGNPIAGGAEFAAAGFGLIGKGLESGSTSTDQQAKDLSAINNALNTLLVNVQSMEAQLTSLSTQISGLLDFDESKGLGLDMANADNWLATYYNDAGKPGHSRAWVSCETAGWGTTPQDCLSPPYPAVTADSLAAFKKAYIKYPKNTILKLNTDNFPLWWAYGVYTGLAAGPTDYTYNGASATDIVQAIYKDITNPDGVPNGLVSYMSFVMSKNAACSTDVTAPACDLYKSVYLPLENYFSLAIGRQTQLVMAQIEAVNVLTQKDKTYGSYAKIIMDDFNNKLNEETEIFLQVAEQIALYRAADGQTDWSNFASTDAGRLLTRADFIVAQLAGKNYDASLNNALSPIGKSRYATSPWPTDGIVGRIFYAANEQIPTGTRSVCSAANGQSCSSSSALLQISGNTNSQSTVAAGKPYLVWSRMLDPTSGAVKGLTGTANTSWFVQRLVPQPATKTTITITPAKPATPATATTPAIPAIPYSKTIVTTPTTLTTSLPPGSDYQVASANSSSLFAKLGFYNYDLNFVTPPGPDTRSVNPDGLPNTPWTKSFGSFNAVVGAIGPNAFKFDTNTLVQDSGNNMPAVVYKDTYGISATTPNALSYSVTYLPNDYNTKYDKDPKGTPSMWGGVGLTPGTWSASTTVQLVIPDYTASKVKFSWPSTLDVNLASIIHNTGETLNERYYQYAKFQQQILSGTTPLTVISDVLASCYSETFFFCTLSNNQSVDVTVAYTTATAANLTFKANFSTEVEQYKTASHGQKNMLSSTSPSVANWTIQAPIITLQK